MARQLEAADDATGAEARSSSSAARRHHASRGTSVFNESTVWFGNTPIILRTDTAANCIIYAVSFGMSDSFAAQHHHREPWASIFGCGTCALRCTRPRFRLTSPAAECIDQPMASAGETYRLTDPIKTRFCES